MLSARGRHEQLYRLRYSALNKVVPIVTILYTDQTIDITSVNNLHTILENYHTHKFT